MKPSPLFFAIVAGCFIALTLRSDAQAPAPAAPLPAPQPPVVSPEVQKDRRVTFRLKAAQAEEVTVSGQSIGTTAMAKDENNV